MRIRYTGKAGRRIVGEYEWNRANGFTQDVADADLAANLLSDPTDSFVVAGDEPLTTLKGVGEQRTAELALAGVANLSDLAALDGEGVERLDRAIWASRRQIGGWVRQARGMLEAGGEEPESEQPGPEALDKR